MDEVVTPAVEFEGSVGWTFFELEERTVNGVIVGDLLQGGWAEEGMHLFFERAGKKTIDIVVAVVREYKSSVLYILAEVGAFLCVELYQFVSADITKGVVKDIAAVEVDHFLLEVNGEGGVFDQ